MKKLLKKSVKPALSSRAVVEWSDDGWDGPILKLRIVEGESDNLKSNGGYISQGGDRVLWSCEVNSEGSCCGFPVMEQINERPDSTKFSRMLGEALNEYLQNKMVYLSTYVPDNKSYTGTRAILEAAGFKRGVTLMGNGKYTNTRWEWFNPRNHQEENEKTVRTCTIK